MLQIRLVFPLCALLFVFACESRDALLPGGDALSHTDIRGVVTDGDGPVFGAVVRVQTTTHYATMADDGCFVLSVAELAEGPFNLTAWAPGYFCTGPVEATAGQSNVELHLHAHGTEDNPDYAWLPSQYHQGEGEDQGCAQCHSREGTTIPFTLPADEWLLDAHSQSATNPRFLTMYEGTDADGNQSPLTRYGYNRDYGRFPLPPDLTKPYYGPGYKLDFPNTAGNCAACHTPAAALDTPYGVDPTSVTGVAAEGVPCDFCHKVWDVRLDPETRMPYENMPGVLSYEFRRPHEGHQFFAGPLDDVAPGEDTYSPVQTESQFCAPCHFGVFWDVLVYNSFGEWLESPYSDPETGQTCQDCHMPPLGGTLFARPEEGGLERAAETIFSHRMPGAADEDLLQNAVTMTVTAQRERGTIVVEVRITNNQTGHHVPTDSPLRHLILLVGAADAEGDSLEQLEGDTVPQWGGVGDPSEGCYAGLPGKAFAKVLEEIWTEVSPTGAYWNPTRVLSDNRLAAFATDTSTYTFDAPGEGEVSVEVTLLFRRAFYDLMRQKSWDVPDIVMEHTREILPPQS
ncbi:MAG: carboxypeptidase regulatory-like domain-containing protein [Phycisphaerae bacterium]|nr:carboxypeptidase regulatory-like domain-containing protein [Phycisphaerae bacterium]